MGYIVTSSIFFIFSFQRSNAFIVNLPNTPQLFQKCTSATQNSHLLSSALNSNTSGNDETDKLLEKAAQLRAEIAQLENKTIEQVEQEAKEKKNRQAQQSSAQSKNKENDTSYTNKNNNNGRLVYVPETIEDQVRQAAGAIERAYKDGQKRQTVRLALIKENSVVSANPEEWPGGAKEMYREAGRPLSEDLLREVRVFSANDNKTASRNNDFSRLMAPNVTSQDIWDFDGSGLVTAQAAAGNKCGDVQALVFPNTDNKYLKDIQNIDEAMGDRLFLLINPFWTNVDSWGFNILAPRAKQMAQSIIFDNGYEETYVLRRFSARGEQCVGLKVYPYDWQLFAYRENDYNDGYETALRLGSSKEEPTSAMFTDLLNEREEFKYSRNMRQMMNKF